MDDRMREEREKESEKKVWYADARDEDGGDGGE